MIKLANPQKMAATKQRLEGAPTDIVGEAHQLINKIDGGIRPWNRQNTAVSATLNALHTELDAVLTETDKRDGSMHAHYEIHAVYRHVNEGDELIYLWQKDAHAPAGIGSSRVNFLDMIEMSAWYAFRHIASTHFAPLDVPTTGTIVFVNYRYCVRQRQYADGSKWLSVRVLAPTDAANEPRSFSTKEAAAQLGCGASSIKRAVKSLDMQATKQRGKLRFSESQIEAIRRHRAGR